MACKAKCVQKYVTLFYIHSFYFCVLFSVVEEEKNEEVGCITEVATCLHAYFCA